ncbi:MAG: nickel pincer cofactor biosynthesis protein LarC [Aridibacter sp.]
MKTLYFDCFAGASGNMILGGLVSLGVEPKRLIDEIKKLNISDFDIEFAEVDRAGINSVHAKTIYAEEKTHRYFSDIKKIIEDSDLSEAVKKRSNEIFKNLAKAEAKVHGIEIEKVHFHEVGEMDAIIDVVGACVSFEILGIEKFICSKIHVGSGFIQIAHGKYPVPPPAVAELLNGIPIYSTEIVGELITPTGAAIISTVCNEFGEISDFQTNKIGYGAGTREYEDFPNVLRIMLGVQSPKSKVQSLKSNEQRTMNNEQLTLIETNIDDISAEILGFVMEKAFDIGALDCWFTPIQMKKNRPATMISILCKNADKEKFAELLYTETSTLGIRIRKIERECLEREIFQVETEFGEIDVKVARYENRIVNIKPEFSQLRKIAINKNLSLKEIEEKVLKNIKDKIEEI